MNADLILFIDICTSFFAVIGIAGFFSCLFNTICELRRYRIAKTVLFADLDTYGIEDVGKEAEYIVTNMRGDSFSSLSLRYDAITFISVSAVKLTEAEQTVDNMLSSSNDFKDKVRFLLVTDLEKKEIFGYEKENGPSV